MKFFIHYRQLYLTIQCIFTLIFIGGSLQNVHAQQTVFTPVDENATYLNTLFTKYEKLHKDELVSLSAENRKDFEKIYNQRWDNIKEKFDKKEIYTNNDAQQYLNALVAEIIKVNPALQATTFTAYFSRSGIPNAAYLGEGIILFNMGLLQKLDNESQVVFVLCHEISHFYLQHSENAIRKYVTAINSEEVQKELRKITKSQYKQGEQLDKLVKGLTFNSRRHSRDHEGAADSMAIEFMRNTKFDISEALTSLGMLDSIDNETLATNDCLQKLFDSKEYPFQQKWIAKEEGLLGGHAKLNKDEPLADSLKTHPGCQLRIAMLTPLVNKYHSGNSLKDVVDRPKLDALKNLSQYEVIEYAYSSNEYTGSLYKTLKLLQTNPSDPYLITQVGKIFNGFYNAQKIHTLGRLIDLPSPYFSLSYNALLQFVQNLYAQDFVEINENFLKQYQPQLDNYAPFKKEYDAGIQIKNLSKH